MSVGLESAGSGQGPVTVSCEHGTKPSGSMQGMLWSSEQLNEDSAPRTCVSPA
jgi:hypothetical protein